MREGRLHTHDSTLGGSDTLHEFAGDLCTGQKAVVLGEPSAHGGFIHPHGKSVHACMCVCTVLESAVCLGAVMCDGRVQPTSCFQKPTFQGQGGLRWPPCGATMNE